MTSRELVIRTLNHEPVNRAPRDLWIAEGMEATHGDAIAEMNLRFPGDIVQPDIAASYGKRWRGKADQAGQYTDSWGCVWQVSEPGKPAELKAAPLAEKGKIAEFRPPLELLDPARFAKVNKSCESTGRFVLARSDAQLFDRLRFLRGHDAALMDLARGTKDVRNLLKMLHEFACREMEIWADTEVDGVALHDDWGTDDSLLISLEMWREIFKPLYREYFKILHARPDQGWSRRRSRAPAPDRPRENGQTLSRPRHLLGRNRAAGRAALGQSGRTARGGAEDPSGLGLRLRRRDRPMSVEFRCLAASHRRRV